MMARTASEFRGIRLPNGTFKEEGWREFLRYVGDLEQRVESLAKSVGVSIPPAGPATSTNAPGTTTGTNGGGSATTDPTLTYVPNTAGANTGNLVTYANQRLLLADTRYRAATHYVVKITANGQCAIRPIGEGLILMDGTDGLSSDTILYLYRDGKATDDATKLRQGGTGRAINGAVWFQPVGVRSGAPARSAIRASVHIFTAVRMA